MTVHALPFLVYLSIYLLSIYILQYTMNPNWQQGQYGGYQQQPTGQFGAQQTGGFMGPQQTGFMGQPQQQQQQQQPMQSMQTGFGGQQQQQQRPMQSNVSPLPTGQQGGGGNYSFLNTQPSGFRPSFTGSSSGLNPQMTGFPGGGASGLLSQQTGFGGGGMGMGSGMMPQQTGMGGMMSQPTGMGGGLMSQPTGMGLRAQPTGVHDPRLQSMMQSFMPSNTAQVCPLFSLETQLISAIHFIRDAPIPKYPTTPSTTIPIVDPEPFGQDAQSPLGIDKAGKEGLRSDF